MKSNRTIFILLGLVIFLIGVYFVLTSSKHYKWYETYEGEDNNPYGDYVLLELLKSSNSSPVEVINQPLQDALKPKENNTNYLFIGDYLPLDSIGSISLLNYVKKGNNAFIASNRPPMQLLGKFAAFECEEIISEESLYSRGSITDSIIKFNLSHPKLALKKGVIFKHIINNEIQSYNWKYVDSTFFCTLSPRITIIGTANDSLINFYRINYGKGNFYFHTNPIVFTNYHLLQKEGRDYAERAFSHLKKGKIYWDEYDKKLTYTAKTDRSESPLKFILSEKSLRMTWYIILGLILLYVIFYAKRKQRIIPVFDTNINSSLEFTETIGKLYFQQNNHQKLGILKMKFFLNFIRERYGLSTNTIDSIFNKKLSLKSGIPLQSIELIFNQYQRIKSMKDVADDTLINFHQALEVFYQNCK